MLLLAFAVEVSSCQVISSPGGYFLTQDLEFSSGTCLEVQSDDVLLDCQGHWITGKGTALSVSGRNVTVRNCNWEAARCFWVSSSDDFSLLSSYCNSTAKKAKPGSIIENSSNVRIRGFHLETSKTGRGVFELNSVQNFSVENSSFWFFNPTVGSWISVGSSSGRFANVSIQGREKVIYSEYFLVEASGSNITFENSTFQNWSLGIYASEGGVLRVRECEFRNLEGGVYADGVALEVIGSRFEEIARDPSLITGNSDPPKEGRAVFGRESNDSLIWNNTFVRIGPEEPNWYADALVGAIALRDSANVSIFANEFLNYSYNALLLWGKIENVSVRENRFWNGGYVDHDEQTFPTHLLFVGDRGYYPLSINCSYVEFLDNEVFQVYHREVIHLKCSRFNLSGNSLRELHHPIPLEDALPDAVYVIGFEEGRIEGNVMESPAGSRGIELSFGKNALVKGNRLVGFSKGFHLNRVNSSVFTRNWVEAEMHVKSQASYPWKTSAVGPVQWS